MCIAIFKPKNKSIKKKYYKTSFNENPDGAGFLYVENNRITIHKGFFTFSEFWSAYSKLNTVNLPMIIHFRIATHGTIDKENCHPFIVNNELGFAHNGIIDIKTKGNESDTSAFNRRILKKIENLPYMLQNSDGVVKLMAKSVGSSKLVFLDVYGEHKIINAHLGTWENGSWFSNHSFKPRKKYNFGLKKWGGYSIRANGTISYLDKCTCGNLLQDSYEKEEGLCWDCIDDSDYSYTQLTNQPSQGRFQS